MSDWKRVPVSEVCELIVDCVNKTAPSVDYRTPYKMIRTPNIKGGRIDLTGCRFVEKETFEKWTRRAKVKPGDVLLTREAPMGEVGIVTVDDNIFLGQRIMQYRADREVLNPRFLLYSFLSADLQNQFRAHDGSGSVVSHIRVPDCLKFEINIPPLDEQDKIVDILGSIDDKIELNRQTNQTLEQIAQAIFKSWFVDFDPVRAKIAAREAFIQQHPEVTEEAIRAAANTEGDTLAHAGAKACELAAICAISGKSEEQLNELDAEILQQLKATAALFPDALMDLELGEVPEGWGCTEITDIADVIKGKSYKSSELDSSKVALVTLKSFMRGGGYRLDGLKEYTGSYKPEQEVFAGDLIVAYTDVTQAADVIGKPAMVIGDSRYEHLVISLDVAVVRPKNDGHKYFLYGLAKTVKFQEHTLAHTTGTTVLHLGKEAVPKFVFAKPEDDLLTEYQRITAPIFDSINERIAESSSLAMIREVVLPRLLSGEMEVGNAS